jgi:hypothetical protein
MDLLFSVRINFDPVSSNSNYLGWIDHGKRAKESSIDLKFFSLENAFRTHRLGASVALR